jgi:hypothetical protein
MNYEESDDNKCEVGEQHKNNNNNKKAHDSMFRI